MARKKLLIVGLGSMGTRRLRVAERIGNFEICVFDLARDRAISASENNQVAFVESLQDGITQFQPDMALICTSPESHMDVAEALVDSGVDCFIEASVVDHDRMPSLIRKSKARNTMVLPSCTMQFFPLPRQVRDLVGERGRDSVRSVSYHTGQHLEDWHPWEDITDYYVSRPETGGCRELVPFELTWLNSIFGIPKVLCASKGKVSSIPAEIDDFYSVSLQYPRRTVLNLFIEIQSRPSPTRELLVVGEDYQFQYSQMLGMKAFSDVQGSGKVEPLDVGHSDNQTVNPDLPYELELAAFFDAVQERDPNLFPNTLEKDIQVLELLELIEDATV
jgi:predicted dehydrogenase